MRAWIRQAQQASLDAAKAQKFKKKFTLVPSYDSAGLADDLCSALFHPWAAHVSNELAGGLDGAFQVGLWSALAVLAAFAAHFI